MEIYQTQQEINKNAHDKGFWDDNKNVINIMTNSGLFTDKQIEATESAFKSQKLLLIVSEVTEAMEADRKHKYIKEPFNGNDYMHDSDFVREFELHIKDTFEDEIADATIRLFDLAEEKQTSLSNSMRDKMRYNSLRSKMHGKKY